MLSGRLAYERLMVQHLALTNDLNEKEDQIDAYKKREAVMESHLTKKEKLHEQDAVIRSQLGKKLQEALMDKEDLKDRVEELTVTFIVITLFDVEK